MSDIRHIQQLTLSIFATFAELCKKNNLSYYLLGGSMLGAVRHQGFIPWDDDIDVGMPREDYQKMLVAAPEQLPTNLIVMNSLDYDAFPYDFTKIIEECGDHETVFLDIFPLDGCPSDNPKVIRRYYRWFNMLRTMKNSHFMQLKGKPLHKRIAVRLLRVIPLATYRKWMERYLLRYSPDDSPAIGNYSGRWGAREIMPKTFYGAPTPVLFEHDTYFGVECPDDYLRTLYGDYRKLPPIEQQKPSHAPDPWVLKGLESSE